MSRTKVVRMVDLEDAIKSILTEYAGNVTEGTKKAVQVVSEATKKDVKQNSPVHARQYDGKRTPGRYKKGWRTTYTEERLTAHAVVHNKTDYQLAHLLEKGHALRQGGRSPAIEHIAPAEQKAIEKFTKAVSEVAQEG